MNPGILLGGFQGGVGRGFMRSVCAVGIYVGGCADSETERKLDSADAERPLPGLGVPCTRDR